MVYGLFCICDIEICICVYTDINQAYFCSEFMSSRRDVVYKHTFYFISKVLRTMNVI